MKKNWIYLFVLFFWQVSAGASDLAKEKRWSEQVSDSLIDGEPVELKAADTGFLGIYTEAQQGDSGRAVILAHGVGVHPDWPDVVHPLRVGLPEHGWSTLSIQMPILENDAELKSYLPLFDEAGPRLAAAADYLRKNGADTVVIVAHSLGAAMAARYVADNPKAVDGLVLVSVGRIEIDPKMDAVAALEKIKLPVFDLYGSRDLESVLSSVNARAGAARKAGNDDFRQFAMEGAGHFYRGTEDALVRRVYGWLKSHFEKTDNESTAP